MPLVDGRLWDDRKGGRDVRRLRPNLLIGGRTVWPNASDSVNIGIHDLQRRCLMTTFDPDMLAHNQTVLRDTVKRFGGILA